MHKLTTLFLYAFLADGLFSVVDIATRQSAPGMTPSYLAVGASIVALLLGLFLFVAMAFTPRVPKRVVLPPILFLGFSIVWAICFGESEALPLSTAETLLALGLIIGFWKPSGAGIQDFTAKRPRFCFRNFAYTTLINGALSLCLAGLIVMGLAQRLRYQFEKSIDHFVSIQPGGVSLEERTFQRGEKEIRLISMIHVAKNGFYDGIAKGLPATATAVVLLEGISDREHQLKCKLDYSNVAQMLGVASQKESSFSNNAARGIAESQSNRAEGRKQTKLEYRSADVDISVFNPDTIRWIQAISYVLNSSSLREIFAKYAEMSETLEHSSEAAFAEVIDKRNEHLLGKIRNALEDHTTIVVPWGAKHMPSVQSEIKKWGFVETSRVRRQAVRFQSKPLVALLSLIDRIPVNTNESL